MNRAMRRRRDYAGMRDWQKEEYFGDHTGLHPAIGNLRGYQPTGFFDQNRVIRAIPVDGTVRNCSAFSEIAPQAWGWTKKDLPPEKRQIRCKGKIINVILSFIKGAVK